MTTENKMTLPPLDEALDWIETRREEFGPTGEVRFDDGSAMILSYQDRMLMTLADEIARVRAAVPEVFISIEGGVVQGVTIKNAPCIVRVYDFDIEGAEADSLSKSLDGEDDCILSEYGPETGDF